MGDIIKSYRDLLIWQKSHLLALKIYRLSTDSQRNTSNFDIWSQCLRSAFSVPANITEGYHGHRGKSFVSYLEVARASAKETEYWTLVLFDINNISKADHEELIAGYREIAIMINSLISKIRK